MNMRDLIPWGRNNGNAPASFESEPMSPFLSLHREMNRVFDEAFRSFAAPSVFGTTQAWPKIEVAERDNEIQVMAELPGMEEKDVEVMLSDGALVIRGERKSEFEDKDRQFSERYFGHFERRIPVGTDVTEDSISATFKNGLLTVTVPYAEGSRSAVKRIPINGRAH